MDNSSKRVRWLLMGGICLLIAFIYRKALAGYFVGDDLDYLYYIAQWTREGRLLPKLLAEFVSPQERGAFYFRPLTISSFALDYLIWGLNPVGWHISNLVLHMANALLLWKVIECIGKGREGRMPTVAGAAAAMLFALRPFSPETVAWISGRFDGLTLLGLLTAILFYLKANGQWNRDYVLSLAGFLLALGSKEAGVTLPGGLLALHLAGAISAKPRDEQSLWMAKVLEVIRGVGPFALLLIVYFVWRFLIFGTPFRVYQSVPAVDLTDSVWRALKLRALTSFLTQELNPTSYGKGFSIATVGLVLAGFTMAWRSGKARRIWVFGGCWLAAVLLPLAQQLSLSTAGEGARLLYIPGAALTVFTIASFTEIPLSDEWRRKRLRSRMLLPAALTLILALFILSFPLRGELLKPWLMAGQSMKKVAPAVAALAEKIPPERFAVLLIPDHVDGALFGRNGQGTLMEPPLQNRVLEDRLIIVTPPSLSEHAPRLASSLQKGLGLEYWCWNVKLQQFEQLNVRPHTAKDWLEAWKSALRDSGFHELAEELVNS